MSWIEEHLLSCTLSEKHETYVSGRGGQDATILDLHLVTWQPLTELPPLEGASLREWSSRYGAFGDKLEGWLVWPLLSPRGKVMGFAGRQTDRKEITRFLLPEASWNPIWTGLTPTKMSRIWNGGDVWIVEGLFDLLPLEWVAPSEDTVLASERAALTPKHIEFLRRHCQGWTHLVYDNDPPGRRGVDGYFDSETGRHVLGARERLERVGLRCENVSYRGKDPGEVWKSGGASAMRNAFPI